MTIEQAKQILRPAVLAREADSDPQITEALALANREPALREWLEGQRDLQNAVRRNLREIPVPANLREQILASRKIIPPLTWWKHPMLWSAAAVLMLLCGAGLWLSDAPDQNNPATFRGRMVGGQLRRAGADSVIPRTPPPVAVRAAEPSGVKSIAQGMPRNAPVGVWRSCCAAVGWGRWGTVPMKRATAGLSAGAACRGRR